MDGGENTEREPPDQVPTGEAMEGEDAEQPLRYQRNEAEQNDKK